jgi:hypothetical protein
VPSVKRTEAQFTEPGNVGDGASDDKAADRPTIIPVPEIQRGDIIIVYGKPELVLDIRSYWYPENSHFVTTLHPSGRVLRWNMLNENFTPLVQRAPTP